jgi:hypothetical protein
VTRLVRNILLFVYIVLLPLYLLDKIVTSGLRKPGVFDTPINEMYRGGLNYDMLIMGSSRARNHFSPCILDSVLPTHSYNIAVDGWSFHMEDYAFRLYLSRNRKPHYIVQLIGWNILTARHDFWGFEQFMPWANDSLLHGFTKEIEGAFTIPERTMPLFIYNNHMDILLRGLKSYFGKQPPSENYCRGFVPLMGDWNGEFEKVRNEGTESFQFYYNDTVVNEFREYLRYCQNNEIKAQLSETFLSE